MSHAAWTSGKAAPRAGFALGGFNLLNLLLLPSAGLARWLSDCRNDLERPAVTLNPGIGETIAAMAGGAGNRLSRMSGSGATVFGLFDGPEAARAAADRLSTDHGDWWVRSCVLGDSTAKVSK